MAGMPRYFSLPQAQNLLPEVRRLLEAAIEARRQADIPRLQEAVESIRELGVQVKDLEVGLIDFPTLYHGGEVLLCYRLGETGIGHWHYTTDGFSGRRKIDRDFVDHHSGDQSQ